MSLLLLTGCLKVEDSAIKTLCPHLPTVSRQDTPQTIIEVDNFNAKFDAAVGGCPNGTVQR